MEEYCTVYSLYLVLYVVSRNICTPSTLFICKIFPTYNEIISVIFIFMTSTDMFYAKYLNTAICAIEYNLPVDHYIIEVHAVHLYSKTVVIGQYFFCTLDVEPYCQNYFLFLFSFVKRFWFIKKSDENVKTCVEPLMLQLQQGTMWLLQ